MIKGTETMQRYPGATDGMERYRGIMAYGRVKVRGVAVVKVPPINVGQLRSIGWQYVGEGAHYAYMLPPQ